MPTPKISITPQERATLIAAKRISLAVTAAIKECPQGAPAGLLYAGLMQYLTFAQFEALMGFLVKSKMLRREGSIYYPMPEPEAEAAE